MQRFLELLVRIVLEQHVLVLDDSLRTGEHFHPHLIVHWTEVIDHERCEDTVSRHLVGRVLQLYILVQT